MPCFSLLKALETQPWLDLCNLFISFQAGLCKLFHEGRAKEAGEGSKHTYRKQTTLGSSLFGRVGSWGKTEMGGIELWGLVWWGSSWGRKLGFPLLLLPHPPEALPWLWLLEPPSR